MPRRDSTFQFRPRVVSQRSRCESAQAYLLSPVHQVEIAACSTRCPQSKFVPLSLRPRLSMASTHCAQGGAREKRDPRQLTHTMYTHSAQHVRPFIHSKMVPLHVHTPSHVCTHTYLQVHHFLSQPGDVGVATMLNEQECLT
jgi:hypothetical protein